MTSSHAKTRRNRGNSSIGCRPIVDGCAPIAATVRQRIERGEERLWRLEDFTDLPLTAVVQSLSRLTRAGFSSE